MTETVPCPRCGRLVVDGSFDFGFGFVLRPGCDGIAVEFEREVVCYVTADELRHFLRTAYGEPEPVGVRAVTPQGPRPPGSRH